MKTGTTTEWQWRQHSFRAMNTDVYVTQLCSRGDAVDQVERLFRRQERCLSRFDAESELAQLNRCAQDLCPVGPELFAALEVALWAATVSAGIYDPTVLADLEQAGYDRTFEKIVERGGFQWQTHPQTEAMTDTLHRRTYDYRSLELHPATRQVRRPPGLGVDLGGMGKGWTVDRAADLLYASGLPFLVNAGGDLYAAGTPGDARGWAIDLEQPRRPELRIARLYVQDRGLATSSTQKRRWSHQGRLQHHLIDPRTQAPAVTDALSVTVIAARTVVAEILAKVALILGAADGLAYLEKVPGVEGLIYTADGRIVYTQGMAPLIDWVAPAGLAFQPV